MDFSLITQYVSYLFIAIGVMAFFVSVVTQVIKELPGIKNFPTSMVVTVLSLTFCLLSMLALLEYLKQQVTWYMLFACILAAFVVAMVSMDGWERVTEIWSRTRYDKK